MFIALRFIVGPANRRETRSVIRKGIRVATNYIIKQFYQQMFFFLTPLYASSATWSLASWNWWLAPLLLVCAVLSTMDLVFDNFIMERRFLASAMYGLAMFGDAQRACCRCSSSVDHLTGLIVAAAATPASVALLSFSVRQVLSPQGALLTLGRPARCSPASGTAAACIPPAPLAMSETAVGHGTLGSYECLPREQARDSREPARRPALRLDAARAGRHQGARRSRVDATAARVGASISPTCCSATTATRSCSQLLPEGAAAEQNPTGAGRARRTPSAVSSSAFASSTCCRPTTCPRPETKRPHQVRRAWTRLAELGYSRTQVPLQQTSGGQHCESLGARDRTGVHARLVRAVAAALARAVGVGGHSSTVFVAPLS